MFDDSMGGALSGTFLLICIIVLVMNILLAVEFSHAAEEKGYTDTTKYFWYCLLFSVGGWLLVCALPDRNAPKPAPVPAEVKMKQQQEDELAKALKF